MEVGSLTVSGIAFAPQHAAWTGDVLTYSKAGRCYDPMEQAGLFHLAAMLEKNDDAIREFALHWGLPNDAPMSRSQWHAAIDNIAALMEQVAASRQKHKDVFADLGQSTCRFCFEQGRTVVHLPDLMTCLRVQVALAASEGWEFTPCELCGTPFIKTGRKRFCSTLCRVKAHQKKGKPESKRKVTGGVAERQHSRIVLPKNKGQSGHQESK